MDFTLANSTEILSTTAESWTDSSGQLLEDELLTLYDDLRRPLLRYAVSFGLPVQDGEDVIQETFLALFRHLEIGRSRENLRGWVFRVTHNLARRHHRRHKGEIRAEEELQRLVYDPSLGPEDLMLFHERQEQLLRVMRALSENDRACLRLRAEGLRYREIAVVLGVSLGSVANSLARSLERLERTDKR